MSFENPPRPKKVESHQLSDFIELEPEIVKPLESEIIPSEISKEVSQSQALDDEIPFIITEKTIGKISEGKGVDSLGEFRQNIGSLFKKMEGLKAVSGKEVREKVSLSRQTPKYSGVLNFQEKEPETISSTIRRGNRGVLNLSSTFGEAETNQPEIVSENKIEKKIGEPKTREELRLAQETRAQNFAEKLGIADKREAMLEAEKAMYRDKVRSYKNPLKKENPAIREKYIDAQLEWRKALKEAAASGDKRTQLEAMIINKRDTIIRPNRVSVEARQEALDAAGKTVLGKAAKWSSRGVGAVLKGYNAGLTKIAEGAVSGHELFLNTFSNKRLSSGEKELYLKNYRKAAGVLSGAAIGTLLTLGAGGAGSFGLRVGRGLLSVAVGAGLGAKAVDFYKKNYGNVAAKELYTQVRSSADTRQALLAQQAAERKGSREARAKKEQYIEMAASIVSGVAVSGALIKTTNLFSHLPSVHHAAGVVLKNEHVPNSHHESVVKAPVKPQVSHERFEHQPHASAGHELPPTKPEAAVPAAGSETLTVDAKIDDANKLIGHFAEKLQHDYQGVHTDHVPPAVKTYQGLFETKPGARLELGENHAAHELGLRAHGLSEIMHKGDTISLNKDNQIVINWAEHGRPPAVLIESDGSVHEFNDMLSGPGRMSAEHVAHHVSAHTAPHAAHETAPHAAPATHTASHGPSSTQVHEASAVTPAHTDTPDASRTPDDGLSQSQRDAYALELKNNGVLPHTETTPTLHPEPITSTHTEAPAVESTPVHTSGVQSEILEHSIEIPRSVSAFTQMPGWDTLRNIPSIRIYEIPASPDDPISGLTREIFLQIVKESGIIPVQNQSVDQYIQLATKAIADKASH